jgi:deoxyribodipyrimidine photolyase
MASIQNKLAWFRRRLRSFDHAALHHATAQSRRVDRAFFRSRHTRGFFARIVGSSSSMEVCWNWRTNGGQWAAT